MKGLDLAEDYYRTVGLPMLREHFLPFEDRIAVGFAGPGSECFGFDDEASRDHDWGPAFCLWLTDEDYRSIGQQLKKAYSELPQVFKSFGPRLASSGEEWRVGVCRTCDFFSRFTGLNRPPETLQEWLRIPENNLATCTNGRVFSDTLGEFTGWRQALLAYYPEDIRLKRIASLCITIAQTGQYNFLRSVKRRETFAASYSVMKFCTDSIQLVFLLNHRYAPFYKWLHRSVSDLPILGRDIHKSVAGLLELGESRLKAELMEDVSVLMADELRRQGLSHSPSDFLLDHAPMVHEKITDPQLARRNGCMRE